MPKLMRPGADKKAAPSQMMAKPSGRAPSASVVSRHGPEMTSRAGRGFSIGELSAAGMTLVTASRWGIQVDLRRRSKLDPNVSVLREWAKAPVQKLAKEGEVKKLEEELVEAEKEISAEIKKEGGKVRKAARKAEKEVAEKVEKPVKARQRKKKAPKK